MLLVGPSPFLFSALYSLRLWCSAEWEDASSDATLVVLRRSAVLAVASMSVSATTPHTMELGIPNCGATQGLLRAARQSLAVPWGRNLCQNPSIRHKGSVTSSASMGPTQSQQGLLQRPPALRLGQSSPVAKQMQSPGSSSSVMAQPQLYVQQRQRQQQQHQQQQSAEQQTQPQTRQQRSTLTRQQEQVPINRQAKLSPATELRLPSQAQPQQSLALAVPRPRQRSRWPTMTNVMCNMVLYKQVRTCHHVDGQPRTTSCEVIEAFRPCNLHVAFPPAAGGCTGRCLHCRLRAGSHGGFERASRGQPEYQTRWIFLSGKL